MHNRYRLHKLHRLLFKTTVASGIILVGTQSLAVATQPINGQPTNFQRSNTQSNVQLVAQSSDRAAALDAQIAELYQAQKFAEALVLAQEALAIREAQLEPGHVEIALSLKDVANIQMQLENFTAAIPLYERALSISDAITNVDLNVPVSILYGLGKAYQRAGTHYQAISALERVVPLAEDFFGSTHINVAYGLTSLGQSQMFVGDYDAALSTFERSLSIREINFGNEHREYASGLHSVGLVHSDTGNYVAAIPLYEQAIAIYRATPTESAIKMAISLASLGKAYAEQNNYSKATPLAEQALALLEQTGNQRTLTIASVLESLGSIYSAQKNYTDALTLQERALSIRESILGKDHMEVGASLNNLALLYAAKQDHIPAVGLYKRALQILEANFEGPNITVASTLHNLALSYTQQGNNTEAIPLFERSISMTRSLYGENHPDSALALNNLGDLHRSIGNYAQAITLFQQANAIEEHNLSTTLASASEARRQEYIQGTATSINANISVHLRDPLTSADVKEQAAQLAMTTIFQRKGRILDSVANTSQRIRERLSTSDRAIFDELNQVRAELAALQFNRAQPSGAGNSGRVRELESRAEALEEELARKSAEFSASTEAISVAAISRQIPQNAALVEFVRYYSYQPASRSDYHYAAYVLTDQGRIQAVDLGAAAEIDPLVASFRQALASRSERADAIAQQLSNKLIEPIASTLASKTHLLLSPDSQLNLIPFDALTDSQGRYLVEEYQISYLNSGRDLLRLETDVSSRASAVVLANPSYADGIGRQTTNAQRSVDASALQFSPLPGTAEEGSAIASILPSAKLLTQQEATENALKQVSAPNILHIATHGFFLPDVEFVVGSTDSRAASLDVVSVEAPVRVTPSNLENPLLRSGLALAGVNNRASDGEDGIFTALEASGLDLYGTQLVVLSACETGVGSASSGEGVYGLRRAFAIAGAQSQLMSLWQVDDAGTSELMQLYYENLIVNKQGRSEALRNAQLEMMKTGTYAHPYYWSSFIFSGDWQPLE